MYRFDWSSHRRLSVAKMIMVAMTMTEVMPRTKALKLEAFGMSLCRVSP